MIFVFVPDLISSMFISRNSRWSMSDCIVIMDHSHITGGKLSIHIVAKLYISNARLTEGIQVDCTYRINVSLYVKCSKHSEGTTE